MRQDFNKLLVERERPGSKDHHHNYRHMKGPSGFKDDEVGGREPMKYHYRIGYETKPFNENLNPLYGWLRSIVGKKWDKSYSTLCKTFDMRGTINAHILQHLYQELETHAFLDEHGRVMTYPGYVHKGRKASHGEAVPISRCGKDYYVCPKDGVVKKTHKEPRRSVIKQREADKLKAELAIKRTLSDTEVLHFIDGIWYHFTLATVPVATIVYDKPHGATEFQTGYSYMGGGSNRPKKTWEELNEMERARFGTRRIVGGTARDLLTGDLVYRDQKGFIHRGRAYVYQRTASGVYHATKKTACKKDLKRAGLIS